MARAPPSRRRTRSRLCSRAARSTSTHAGRRAASRSSTPGPSASGGEASEGSATRFHSMPVEIAEAGGLAEEDHLDRARLAVAVLGDDQLREALVLVRGVVDLVAVDEGHHVGVLLDRSRLAKVRELRPMIAAPPLRLAGELRQGDDGDLQLLGELLHAAADGGNLQVAVLVAAARL